MWFAQLDLKQIIKDIYNTIIWSLYIIIELALLYDDENYIIKYFVSI